MEFTNSTAKHKAIFYYQSCIDKEKKIDELGDQPLRDILEDVGFWNVSGNFSLDEWDFEEQLVRLHGFYANSGVCHDWADAEWIVIRGPIRGHNDTPFERPTPGRPIGRLGVGHPQGVYGVVDYY